MNRISQIRQVAGIDIQELADQAGVDVLEAAMAENGIGVTHLDVVNAIAEVLDSTAADLYPDVADHLSAIEAVDDDVEAREAMLSPEHAVAFAKAGIDPDLATWFAIVTLASGNERRYRISSTEKDRVREELTTAGAKSPWLVFGADCRNVVVRRSALKRVTFRNTASYAPFSSRESAFRVLMISSRHPRPEEIAVEPDGGGDDEAARPFSDFVLAAKDGGAVQDFILLADDDGETLMGVGEIELMEIPVGVVVPELYSGEPLMLHAGDPDDLETMQVMGEA